MSNDNTNSFTAAVLQYCAKGEQERTLPVVKSLVEAAARAGAEFVCLPECANFLAADKDALIQHCEVEERSPSLTLLTELAQTHQIIISAGSLMMRDGNEGRAINRSYLISANGEINARYDKIHMFDANVGDGKNYRESDHFRPGNKLVTCQTDKGHIGLSICYDIRFAELYRKLALRGAELITIPAAFTQVTGQAHWHVLQRARAIETGSFILSSAQYGTHDDGRKTYGHSLIVNPWGEILADARTMEEGFVLADIDLSEVSLARKRIYNLRHNPDYSSAGALS